MSVPSRPADNHVKHFGAPQAAAGLTWPRGVAVQVLARVGWVNWKGRCRRVIIGFHASQCAKRWVPVHNVEADVVLGAPQCWRHQASGHKRRDTHPPFPVCSLVATEWIVVPTPGPAVVCIHRKKGQGRSKPMHGMLHLQNTRAGCCPTSSSISAGSLTGPCTDRRSTAFHGTDSHHHCILGLLSSHLVLRGAHAQLAMEGTGRKAIGWC